jgi:LppX_LprAFG lipoprotein
VRLRAVLALCLAGACAALVAGCGGVSLDPVAKAANKTTGVDGAHVEFAATVGLAGQQGEMTGSGDFDSTGASHLTANIGPVELEEVMDGLVFYLRSAAFGPLPKGKSWIKVDTAKTSKSLGVDTGSITSQNPMASLDQLKQVADVEEIGSETVDGVAAKHFRATLDAEKTKAKLGAKASRLLKPEYRPIDVWVGDDDGYVHQLKMNLSYVNPPTNQRVHMDMTMKFSDFGKAVDVSVPAAAEVFDATDAAAAQLNGG